MVVRNIQYVKLRNLASTSRQCSSYLKVQLLWIGVWRDMLGDQLEIVVHVTCSSKYWGCLVDEASVLAMCVLSCPRHCHSPNEKKWKKVLGPQAHWRYFIGRGTHQSPLRFDWYQCQIASRGLKWSVEVTVACGSIGLSHQSQQSTLPILADSGRSVSGDR